MVVDTGLASHPAIAHNLGMTQSSLPFWSQSNTMSLLCLNRCPHCIKTSTLYCFQQRYKLGTWLASQESKQEVDHLKNHQRYLQNGFIEVGCCEAKTLQSFMARFILLLTAKDIITIQSYRYKIQPSMVSGQYCTRIKDLQLVRGLSASRINLEIKGRSLPCSQLLGRKSSNAARSGCHIYGIKCLAPRPIIWEGKGKHETPHTHHFLCSLINESWKNHLQFRCWLHEWCSSLQAHVYWCSPCHRVPLGVFREQVGSIEVLGLVMAEAFASSGDWTKPPPVWSGSVERTVSALIQVT